jgi:hypothetical protein
MNNSKPEILIAKEEWDNILNNYRPSGISPNWEENNIHSFPYNLGPYLYEICKKGVSMSNFINPKYKNTKYIDKKLLHGKKYFYVINIYEPLFFHFNKTEGFKNIDSDIINDIQNDNCKLILVQDVEGLSGMKNSQFEYEYEFKIVEKWCEMVNIPYQNVYYISGNLKSGIISKEQNLSINVIPITVQEAWNNVFNFDKNVVEFKPNNEKYLFLNYSRRPRLHRTFFTLNLLKEKLDECGLWSFNFLEQEANRNELLSLDYTLEPYIDFLEKNSPFLIDEDNSGDNITTHVPINDYETTFITVVGETLYDESVLFISEKTWKPIIVGTPFIILGNPHTLEYLKKEGFKTFDKWIDESYDLEIDLSNRVQMIINEIKKLKSKSLEELIEIRKEMKPICEFNKKLMRERTSNKFYESGEFVHNKPTSDIINEIWNNWKK